MDNSSLIQEIRKHISSGQKDSYTLSWLVCVRKAIAEKTASPDQQTQLVTLEKELADMRPQSNPSFPGSTANTGYGKIQMG